MGLAKNVKKKRTNEKLAVHSSFLYAGWKGASGIGQIGHTTIIEKKEGEKKKKKSNKFIRLNLRKILPVEKSTGRSRA